MSGMFGVQQNQKPGYKSVEWYTPKWVFDALDLSFDLDPCSPHNAETFVPATTKYNVFDNGLAKPWFGLVWLNPPYGRDTGLWIRRMIDHGDGVALVFSRTDVSWFQDAMRSATAILFLSGRIAFVPGNENSHKKSTSCAGTAMFAFGERSADALAKLADRGFFIRGVRAQSLSYLTRRLIQEDSNKATSVV